MIESVIKAKRAVTLLAMALHTHLNIGILHLIRNYWEASRFRLALKIMFLSFTRIILYYAD